jgi:hypothetical protein
MPSLSGHDDDPQPQRGNRGLLVPVIVVVIFVLLHVAGVFGAGSH